MEAVQAHGIAVRSGKTTKLILYLEEHAKPGRVFTDEELSALIDQDVSPRGGGYCYLASARRHMERQHAVYLSRERNAGILRVLDERGRISCADGHRIGANKKLRRGAMAIATLDRKAIPVEERGRADAIALSIALAVAASETPTMKRIEASNVNNNGELDARAAIRTALSALGEPNQKKETSVG